MLKFVNVTAIFSHLGIFRFSRCDGLKIWRLFLFREKHICKLNGGFPFCASP